jgi:hypothetical protein
VRAEDSPLCQLRHCRSCLHPVLCVPMTDFLRL